MSPVMVIIEHVLGHQPFEMPFIQDDHMIKQPSSTTSNPALSDAVLPRTAKGNAGVGWLPMSLTAETTSAPNFGSRSNTKNRCGCL
jgi:hypothetical protein